jgi:predicted aconitase
VYLTREEERIYDGESGWANQVSMKILVRLGELFNATRLIPISSAHISGVSYKTLGDAPVEFLEAMTKSGARVNAKTTLNPQSVDLGGYLCGKLPASICKKQTNVLACLEKMGCQQSLTCTPYYLERPERDSHLAWAESSAVVYANSVLGAWTNREGGPSALAAALIGKTPDYGIHKAENRQPRRLIELEKPLRAETEFGALGIYLGKVLEDKIPVIQGLKGASVDDLKQLGASLASTGMVDMFYHKDKEVKGGGVEKLIVEEKDVKQTVEELTTTTTDHPDLIFLGCPHCSLNEIEKIAKATNDRKVRAGTELWVCTSCYIKEKAAEQVKKIEKCGGHVITDTCAVVTWTDKLGIRTIMTNSAKTAYYAPTLNKAETILASTRECLETAFKG